MNQRPGRLPVGLRTIALFEAAKGILALAAACGLLSLRHTDLQAAADAFLLRHGINPERHYTHLFIETVARATHHHVGQIAGVAIAYGLMRLAEGYGLWRGKHWAEWFAVISAGLYLPLEVVHFAHRPRLFTAAIMLLNLVLIYYLGRLLVRQRAERKRRRRAKMKSRVSVFLMLAFAGVSAGGAVHSAQSVENLQPETSLAASSSLMAAWVPQLAAASSALSQAPGATNLDRIAPPPPAPLEPGRSRTAGQRRTAWMILLLLAVLVGSYLLQRLRSRADPPG
jgi:uncharacterized membrane protein (DUF2068 family)